ncbi:hypothetical protein [Bacillus nitratireducens]|uniref:hypothetical protein n=1 Tax=Bacillus nitratireducens TaxID=2026193 RepID=UPI002E79452B|nr:hypothetical protein [Bacillus nitratireducens]
MTSSVTDKTLAHLADSSYRDASNERVKIGNHVEVWRPVNIKGAILHDEKNSFDATVYKNEETKQIVIAFRGSQEGPDFYDADLLDVVGNRLRKNQDSLDQLNKLDTSSLPLTYQANFALAKERAQQVIAENQFTYADDLVKKVKNQIAGEKEFEGYKLTLTGHSLGGGLSEYTGVMNDINAVSYEAPNVIDLLPKDKKEKALRGDYKNQITSVGDPYDTVFTGFKGNDNDKRGRIGHVYHTNDTGVQNNDIVQETSSMFTFLLKPSFFVYNALRGIASFVGGPLPKYHSMDRYMFDKYGHFNMENIFDGETGERILGSPRAGEITIRLLVEEVKQIAKDLKREIDDINQKLVQTSNKIINILHQSPASVDGNLINTITYGVYGFQRGYMERIRSEADFIEQQADKFKNVDEQG